MLYLVRCSITKSNIINNGKAQLTACLYISQYHFPYIFYAQCIRVNIGYLTRVRKQKVITRTDAY